MTCGLYELHCCLSAKWTSWISTGFASQSTVAISSYTAASTGADGSEHHSVHGSRCAMAGHT